MKMRRKCPDGVALTRFYFERHDEEIAEHVRQCTRCADELEALSATVATAKELSPATPSPEHADRIWEEIEERTSTEPSRPMTRRTWVAAMVGIAAMTLALLGYGLYSSLPKDNSINTLPAQSCATIYSSAAAKYVTVSKFPDEIIRLRSGSITINVDHLADNEHFRVVVGDAEVEVRGTVFEVTSVDDRLKKVHVMRGKVEVRYQSAPAVILNVGERWARPQEHLPVIAQETAAPDPNDVGALKSRRQARLTSTARRHNSPKRPGNASQNPNSATQENRDESLPSPAEAAFNDGWHLLRAGNASAAALQFVDAAHQNDDTSLAEDAQLWAAIAFDRAGRSSDAEREFRTFLRRFPNAVRYKEVSAILGWKLLHAGKTKEAEHLFNIGLTSTIPRIRADSQRGLRKLKH